jgi:hypothetical protein
MDKALGSGSRMVKNPPPNKQFIPHHLSRTSARAHGTKKKLFSSRESQNYIFSVWFVGVSRISRFFLSCVLESTEEL